MLSGYERLITIFLPCNTSNRGHQSKETFKVTPSSVTKEHKCYSR